MVVILKLIMVHIKVTGNNKVVFVFPCLFFCLIKVAENVPKNADLSRLSYVWLRIFTSINLK